MKATIARVLPAPMKAALRNTYFSLMDRWDALSGRNGLMPPRRMIFIGDGDFRKTGQEFFRLFQELGGLKPEDRVLDVGSGIGRMAIPLISFLREAGSYDGIEIVRDGVDWCAGNISPKNPRFKFHWVNVYNLEYNPQGRIKASEYRFPFPDDSFDFIFLTSVFTHMMPADLENYISEIARVMSPGGRLFATFFLLNPESRDLIRKGSSSLNFNHEGLGYLTINPTMPECAIAFPEEYVLGLLENKGFSVQAPMHYGSWSGRSMFTSYQDIILASKNG